MLKQVQYDKTLYYGNLKSLKSNNLSCLFRARDGSRNSLWNDVEQRLQRTARPEVYNRLLRASQ